MNPANTNTANRHDAVAQIARTALAWIGDQQLVSQSRCVDVLLDLHQASDDPFTRWAITRRIAEMRFLRVVEGDLVRADLNAIADLATSGVARDGWCERLLATAHGTV